MNEDSRKISLTELPPLQKVPPVMGKSDPPTSEDVLNSNITEQVNTDSANGNGDVTGSIDSLEANVSSSHIVNINDLESESGSTHDVEDYLKDDTSAPIEAEITNAMSAVDSMVQNAEEKVDETLKDVTKKSEEAVEDVIETVSEKAELVDEMLMESVEKLDPTKHEKEVKKVLVVPDKILEIANSPPPKSPILQDLLHVSDITHIDQDISKNSDDGQSENETIPCGSDKSSPLGKTKTQAVMPIVRSEDSVDTQPQNCEDTDVEANEKGRFSKMFQSLRDTEKGCMGRGKVIEEKIVETVHKGIDGTEETVHKMEETVETEIKNQTNSRLCTIL